jgi:hypothetical protein
MKNASSASSQTVLVSGISAKPQAGIASASAVRSAVA